MEIKPEDIRELHLTCEKHGFVTCLFDYNHEKHIIKIRCIICAEEERREKIPEEGVKWDLVPRLPESEP